MKIGVSRDMKPCRLANIHQCFGGALSPFRYSSQIWLFRHWGWSKDFSVTPVTADHSTYVSESPIIHRPCCDNLGFCTRIYLNITKIRASIRPLVNGHSKNGRITLELIPQEWVLNISAAFHWLPIMSNCDDSLMALINVFGMYEVELRSGNSTFALRPWRVIFRPCRQMLEQSPKLGRDRICPHPLRHFFYDHFTILVSHDVCWWKRVTK
jgi:hypothetical protein